MDDFGLIERDGIHAIVADKYTLVSLAEAIIAKANIGTCINMTFVEDDFKLEILLPEDLIKYT